MVGGILFLGKIARGFGANLWVFWQNNMQNEIHFGFAGFVADGAMTMAPEDVSVVNKNKIENWI